MAPFTSTQVLDMFACLGPGNMSYDETAAYLNQKYGADFTGSQVGRKRREYEDRVEAGEPVESVLVSVVVHGYADILVSQ